MKPESGHLLDRRAAIRTGVTATLGLLAMPENVARALQELRHEFPWPWDIDGDGTISEADRSRIATLSPEVRGNRTRPRDGWDPRLDFASVGRIDADLLRSYDATRPALGTRVPPRPITACWHYGWYSPGRRRKEAATVRYLGGSYLSSDRSTEEDFNAIKDEFGISADILSWIDDRAVQRAYERGYLSARNRDRRRFGLLYESPINLRATGRIDLSAASANAAKLADDFKSMGEWLRLAVGPDGPGLLRIDGRPVIYLFGSHTFGPTNAHLPDVGAALVRARAAFTRAFSTAPYLIGDESIFAGDAEVGYDRRYRARHFDAVTRYHHYDAPQIRGLGNGTDVVLDAAHRHRLLALEERSAAGFRAITNRFTDAEVLVIPSSAAGFAKRGLPTLLASRDDYTELLRDMQRFTDAHLASRHRRRLNTPALEAPLVLLGSWNEEFEGHALMPAAMNRAVPRRGSTGFDWLNAVKSVYGVARNHAVARPG